MSTPESDARLAKGAKIIENYENSRPMLIWRQPRRWVNQRLRLTSNDRNIATERAHSFWELPVSSNQTIAIKFDYSTLHSTSGISAAVGFGRTLATAKKADPNYFNKGMVGSIEMVSETGANLAMRALGWGTLFAFLGTGSLAFAIWKLSGARDVSVNDNHPCYHRIICVIPF